MEAKCGHARLLLLFFFKAGQNDKLNKVSLLPLRLAFGLMSNVAFHTNTKAVATWLS